MILSVHLYRWDMTPYEKSFHVADFELGVDEINADATSTFSLPEDFLVERGDWLRAKYYPSGKQAYFGVVESQENRTIHCRGLLGLADSEIMTHRVKGNSFEAHARKLILDNLVNDSTKNLSRVLDVQVESNTAHSYQADGIGSRKLNSYLVNGFKKYNIKWAIKDVQNKKIFSVLRRVTKQISIKDSSSEFRNWDVYIKKPGSGTENKLVIVDAASKNMESPNILATYYLINDDVTTNANHKEILKPTVTKVYLYDRTLEDAPTYLEVAQSELSGNSYSHEISFDIDMHSKNIDVESLETGMLATLYVKGQVLKSVLTAYRVSSDSNAFSVTFGNVRSRTRDYFDE